MDKEQFKEFRQNLWCALNCATSNEEQFKIMELIGQHLGMEKWREYCDSKKDIFRTSMQEMKRLLSSIKER